MAMLQAKEDKKDFNMCWYVDLWFNNIFHPLYGIGESEVDSFLAYETYMHNIARNKVILSEKPDGMTNKQFVDNVLQEEKSYIEGMDERVIFEAKTDEQRLQEEIDATKEHQIEESISEGVENAEQ